MCCLHAEMEQVMDTTQLYKRVLLGDCLNELKGLRDQARRSQWYSKADGAISFEIPKDLCVISDRGERDFEFVMKRSREILYESIVKTTVGLLKEYGVEARVVQCGVANAKLFKALDRVDINFQAMFNQLQTAAVLITDDDGQTLFILKRFGISEQWPTNLVEYVRSNTSANKARLVSLVDEKAYIEMMDHNEDEEDPTRGTGILSLKDFFESYFSAEEYGTFRRYLDRLAKEARTYFGYRVVKSLSPNSACLFRREVSEAIRLFDYRSVDEGAKLSEEQYELLAEQFFDKGTCEALTGTNDFASSFMTAEWLYQSLQGSERIDLSPIIMDYYKSVEQYLFQFLCLHTEDAGERRRKVYVLNRGYTLLNSIDELQGIRDGIALSGLTGFIGHRDIHTEKLQHRNKDLLRSGITDDTYSLIVDELESIPKDRNGYFHKNNLYSWEDVESARNKTYFIFYLLLGSYQFKSTDNETLDMCHEPYGDDFNMLCSYVNESAHLEGIQTTVPIFYLNEAYGEQSALVACPNTSVVGYDERYGIPQYSKLEFRRLKSPKEEPKITLQKSDVKRVEQGELVMDRMRPFVNGLPNYELTRHYRTVYEDGIFLS